MLAPLGGAKGFALGLLVETLTGGIVGPNLAADVTDMFAPSRTRSRKASRTWSSPSTLPGSISTAGPEERLDELAARVSAAGGRMPGSGRDPLRPIPAGTEIAVPADLIAELARGLSPSAG